MRMARTVDGDRPATGSTFIGSFRTNGFGNAAPSLVSCRAMRFNPSPESYSSKMRWTTAFSTGSMTPDHGIFALSGVLVAIPEDTSADDMTCLRRPGVRFVHSL